MDLETPCLSSAKPRPLQPLHTHTQSQLLIHESKGECLQVATTPAMQTVAPTIFSVAVDFLTDLCMLSASLEAVESFIMAIFI